VAHEVPGLAAAELDPRVYAEGDLVADGRYAFDAFIGSDLEEILRDRGIETVFIAGFTTDQCVTYTVKTALDKGFDAYMVSDCCATFASGVHRLAERRLRGHVVSLDEITGHDPT